MDEFHVNASHPKTKSQCVFCYSPVSTFIQTVRHSMSHRCTQAVKR